MNILLCDFVGHAFPLELSGALVERGHRVTHTHLSGFVVGKGPFDDTERPAGVEVLPIDLGAEFPKYRPAARAGHELRFAARLTRWMARERPDVIIMSTTPPLAQYALTRSARLLGIRSVIWLQDILAKASESDAQQIIGRGAGLTTRAVELMERTTVRRADHVVAISESFRPYLHESRVPDDRITVIENWAPLSGIEPEPRDNAWARARNLVDERVLLYAGTLGYKHDWTLLRDVAAELDPDGERLVVVSEGEFADELRAAVPTSDHRLMVEPFQPFDQLRNVLASSDVCVALLTDEASEYSVPSKVQSYLAAGRPVVMAGAPDGDAARSIVESGAGVVVRPSDRNAFVAAALDTLRHPGERGTAARQYAEANFSVSGKADAFERILGELTGTGRWTAA